MAKVVNLEKIVSYVFESEIESQPDEVTRESKRKEKTEVKPKKTSVKSKLKEGKEKVSKTLAKKTKEKEAQACV